MTDARDVAALLDAWHDEHDEGAAAILRQRLAASAVDRAAYWRWMQIHRAVTALGRHAGAERSGRRVAQRPSTRRRAARARSARRSRGLGAAFAVLVTLALVTGAVVWRVVAAAAPIGWLETTDGRQDVYAGETYRVPAYAVLSMSGARVTFEVESVVSCPAGARARMALTDGRARVAVEPRTADEPLVIDLPRVAVEVVGTRFVVAVEATSDLVVVEEGSVRCRVGDASEPGIVVAAGREGRFSSGVPPRIADQRNDTLAFLPLAITGEMWQPLQRHGRAASSVPAAAAIALDFDLAAPPIGEESWATLVARPERRDWSDAAGIEITYYAPPVPGVVYWFEADDSEGPDVARWQIQYVNLPASTAIQTRRFPFADFRRRASVPDGRGLRWESVSRCGFGAASVGAAGSGRIVVSELRLYRTP